MKRILLAVIVLSLGVRTVIAQNDTRVDNTDYGVEEANNKFAYDMDVLGGRDDYDLMNLADHPDVSGVPLGGIGAGNVNFSPSGRFVRIGMNNIHMPIKRTHDCFFALWQGSENGAVRLVRDSGIQYGMPGAEHSYYKGLFPTALLKFSNDIMFRPEIYAWSGLIPQNTKDSSLPAAWFEISLTSDDDREVSVAFSWEDFIGLYRDPLSTEGMDGQVLQDGRNRLCNGEEWPVRSKPDAMAKPYSDGKVSGIIQYSEHQLEPRRYTFQNYNDHVAVLAEVSEGDRISVLPAFSSEDGEELWRPFVRTGEFDAFDSPSSLSSGGTSRASAVAVKTRLKAGETKTIRFLLVWYCPEIKIDAAVSPDRYWKYGGDYNKYYHNSFDCIEDVISYVVHNRKRIHEETVAWHEPILKSTLPDWYKFKLINSGYVIYTNMVLNKKGDVMVNEGAMGGLAGTMDQRISAHPFYQKFFTDIDRSEMEIFADAMDPAGYILHFIGHYYMGMGTVGGRVPTEKSHMLDNSSGWLIQLVKDYQQTGDLEYLMKHAPKVARMMEYLKSCRPAGSSIPVGKTTYDDYEHPPLYSYYAGVWLATLKAYREFGKAAGDDSIVNEASQLLKTSHDEIIDKLWTGKFFAYGCEPDGSGCLDDTLFTGQLAGQFISRYCGWGDIYSMDKIKKSLDAQFRIPLSSTPDYYANKVWDIRQNKGVDWPQSQCWPFYLESYTAMAGIQAGSVDDGLEIMRHIQLVHLRHGWTWTQNLWNPSDITYMTAPVTWFSTDVLAGAGINIPEKELRLAPIVKSEKVVLPLFYPGFWATLTADPSSEALTLKITKTYKGAKAVFDKVIAEPAGVSADERRRIDIKPFKVREGAVLDLSKYYDEIVCPVIEKPVLQ